MTSQPFTRKDYMASPFEEQQAAYRRYYAQFVTPAVISCVRNLIGESRIKSSTDPCLSDIPLAIWDRAHKAMKHLCLSHVGDSNCVSWSLNDSVCVAKEAAKRIQEGK